MYWLNSMIPLRLYKNKRFFYTLSDPKKKYMGNLIFLDTFSKKESIDTINNPLINNKYTRCYYIDRTTYVYIRGMKKRKMITQSAYYKDVKSKCKEIKKTDPNIANYNGLSTYYDMSINNSLFYENAVMAEKAKIKAYLNNFKELCKSESVSSYSSYFMLAVIDKSMVDYQYIRDSYHGFLSMILNTAYYYEDMIADIPNMDLIILGATSGRMFHCSLHSITKRSLNILKRLLNILCKLERNEELSPEESAEDAEAETAEAEEEIVDSNPESAKILLQTAIEPKSEAEKEIYIKVDDKINNVENTTLDGVLDELNNDAEFLQFLDELKQEKITAEMYSANTARNELLKAQQKEIRINNNESIPSIEETLSNTEAEVIHTEVMPIKDTRNKKVLETSTLKDFEKSYNENLDYKDKMTILNSLSDDNRSIKVYILNISKEDSSDAFTKKETWTIDLEDEKRTRHTIKVDFPTLLNDKFMYIEGNKKILNKQLCLLPIIKNSPDTVQIVTNSNKTFITRFGGKISPKTEKFKKFIGLIHDKGYIEYKLGNNFSVNKPYLTNIEYDELSENYTYLSVTINKKTSTIYFNQEILRNIYAEKKWTIPTDKNIVPIGIYENTEPIYYDMTNNVVQVGKTSTEINLIDYIVSILTPKHKDILDIWDNISIGKRYIYTRCSILNRKIPLLLFLAYNEGLSTILHKAHIRYTLSDKRRVLSKSEKEIIGVIPFKDTYLYYDIYPIKNSFLMNSLLEINTQDYTYEMFDNKDIYLDIFYGLYGSRAIAKGFDNFYELFIDGITKEVLTDLNYPTNITDIFIYANELLQDNQYIYETDMSNYRIRSNEMINVIFEKELESAYVAYKNSVNGATPIKISIPQNAIIKALTTNKYGSILQDYDTLNPIKETDSVSTVTYKGPSGLAKLASSF